MKKPVQNFVLAITILVVVAVVAGAIYSTSGASKSKLAPVPVVVDRPAPAPAQEPVTQIEQPAPQPPIEKPAPQIPDIAATPQKPQRAKTPAQDPMARVALSYVGTDSDANALWMDAINNPKLSAKERKNLIEDLNEDGLSNPKHPQIIDVPLIASRLQLIEQLRPDAMDDVNARAFDEAHKDLTKMYLKLTGTAWGE